MFTSSRFAPPRTCSSATSTALWKSFASMSRRNLAEPVTFVRSPTTTKPVSGRMTNGSRPEKRGKRPRLRHSARRQAFDRTRDRARVLRRRPAATADEIDEAVLGERPQEAARIGSLLVVQTEGVRQPGVGMARDVRRRDSGEALEERPHLGRTERAVDARR